MTTEELKNELKREAERRDALDADRDAVRQKIDGLPRRALITKGLHPSMTTTDPTCGAR